MNSSLSDVYYILARLRFPLVCFSFLQTCAYQTAFFSWIRTVHFSYHFYSAQNLFLFAPHDTAKSGRWPTVVPRIYTANLKSLLFSLLTSLPRARDAVPGRRKKHTFSRKHSAHCSTSITSPCMPRHSKPTQATVAMTGRADVLAFVWGLVRKTCRVMSSAD